MLMKDYLIMEDSGNHLFQIDLFLIKYQVKILSHVSIFVKQI